ncbi:MAG: hypothetical protein Q9181_005435 [Wetmoreana brouardii]
MVRSPVSLAIQNIGDDPKGPSTSYRVSKDDGRIVYVTIDADVFDEDDYCFTPALIDQLPAFPAGDWNKGHIAKTKERPDPHFTWTRCATLPRVTSTWHKTYVEYKSLELGERLRSDVYEALHPELGEVVAKYAAFEWEIGCLQAETEAYAWIDGHDIGPKFLGHLTEEGRVIGFVMEKLQGRHARVDDLASCAEVVQRLHTLGILHGDLNRHNLLITEDRTALIDFETCTKDQDQAKMAGELQGLKQDLLDNSGTGRQKTYQPQIAQLFDEIYRRDGGMSEEMQKQVEEGRIIMTSEEHKKLLAELRAGRTAYVPV